MIRRLIPALTLHICTPGIAPTYDFLIYAAAVGAYFKGGQLSPIDLIVEERFHRAAPGGTGGTKAAGNYTPVEFVSGSVGRTASSVILLQAVTLCPVITAIAE